MNEKPWIQRGTTIAGLVLVAPLATMALMAAPLVVIGVCAILVVIILLAKPG